MFDFSKENTILAREWILKLFENKKFYHSAIYKNDEVMWDAIIKYEDDLYAFPKLEEDQFNSVFSAFVDNKILVVHNFPFYLNKEHFVKSLRYTQNTGPFIPEYQSDFELFSKWHPIAFVVSKEDFDYKLYCDFCSQLSWIAFIDQKSGRTMIALPELNFLIYP